MNIASDANITEESRRVALVAALTFNQGAAEALAAAAGELATRTGNAAFMEALQAEVKAGAITSKYPPGVTTSLVHASSEATSAGAALAEPDVRVFRTLFAAHGAASGAAAAVAPPASAAGAGAHVYSSLADVCEILDQLCVNTRPPYLYPSKECGRPTAQL